MSPTAGTSYVTTTCRHAPEPARAWALAHPSCGTKGLVRKEDELFCQWPLVTRGVAKEGERSELKDRDSKVCRGSGYMRRAAAKIFPSEGHVGMGKRVQTR